MKKYREFTNGLSIREHDYFSLVFVIFEMQNLGIDDYGESTGWFAE